MNHEPVFQDLEALIGELVSWDSITHTRGERDFPYRLQEKLLSLPCFQRNPERVRLHDGPDGRQSLSALYRAEQPETDQTIVLISHFDTVDTREYGALSPLAFDAVALTEKIKASDGGFADQVLHDAKSGEYLFGRGIMDMKAGLAIHLHILEKAAQEKWPVNLLLVTVHDEEGDSDGMRSMIPVLHERAKEEGLTWRLFLNGEPSFPVTETDESQYMYTGSAGKLMPAVVVKGQGTHGGEGEKGISAPFMLSYVTREMEWNPVFSETVYEEENTLPVTLSAKDMKKEYSVQTPAYMYSMFNLLILKQGPDEVMAGFRQVVEDAMAACEADWHRKIPKAKGRTIRVMTYEELAAYAEEHADPSVLAQGMQRIAADASLDLRERCMKQTEWLISLCPELGPVAVCLYVPPYYPAVNSSDSPLIQRIQRAVYEAGETNARPLTHRHYFNGISDLSYVQAVETSRMAEAYVRNMPLDDSVYHIPFREMAELDAPVFNLGPFGKDPHLVSERLHRENAFHETPRLITAVIQAVIAETD
ncbi:M20/M25/M40 family metallo-hydrolase [Salisediminibacterium selenitireducens]|uniref:Peptidase M20 n=1 Tax=Bacillus selenitireducens (strain ATCC 700615 / DSM 15326 / MLS10) TaxID=439292 RepID=D6XZB7_BACIE|nr:M20/M25/M40 family metallo-hydrolase [Salisediminibacterium selenitireducens]ADI00402.1 peptidase M20 [[Bacillus] selenitireducens MLS10]